MQAFLNTDYGIINACLYDPENSGEGCPASLRWIGGPPSAS